MFEHGFEPKLFRFDITQILEPKFNSGTQVWNLGFALSLGSKPGLDLGLDIDEGTLNQTVTTFSPLSRSRGVGSVAGHWPVRQRMLSGGSKTIKSGTIQKDGFPKAKIPGQSSETYDPRQRGSISSGGTMPLASDRAGNLDDHIGAVIKASEAASKLAHA